MFDEQNQIIIQIGNIPCSWIRKLNNIKMSVLTNLIFRFNAMPIKVLGSYFEDVIIQIIKFI